MKTESKKLSSKEVPGKKELERKLNEKIHSYQNNPKDEDECNEAVMAAFNSLRALRNC